MRRAGGPTTAKQELTLRVDGDVTDAQQRAIEALEHLPAKVRPTNDAATVLGRTPVTWRGWGERIRIDVRPAGKGAELTVKSRPIPSWAPFDLGVGARNVQQLADAIGSRQR